MTDDPAIHEGLAAVAESVVKALGSVQESAGPVVASHAAELHDQAVGTPPIGQPRSRREPHRVMSRLGGSRRGRG